MSKKTDEEAQAFIDSLAVTKFNSLAKMLSRQDVPYVSKKGEIPPYLDPSNKECYSKEIAIIIEVWMQLFQSGAPIKNQRYNLLDQIKKVLKKKGIASDRAINRLASVINPDDNKRGGGTHTKKKVTSKRNIKK